MSINVKSPGFIRLRETGLYEIRFQKADFNGGKPKSYYAHTEAEAKKKLEELRKKYYRGEVITTCTQSVSTYMKNWLYTVKRNELKPLSFDRMEQTLLYQVLPSIGMIQVPSLNSDDIQKMVNHLKDKGYSYSTVKKAYQCVNNCFKRAVEQRKLDFNPAVGVSIPRKDSFDMDDSDDDECEEIKCFTPQEAEELIREATARHGNGALHYRLGYVVPLVLNTGLRVGELIALRWKRDIDLEKRTITIHGNIVVVKNRDENAKVKTKCLPQKSPKSAAGRRKLKLNERAYDALVHLYEINKNSPYVVATKPGKPVSARNLDRLLRCVQARVGIPPDKRLGMHALRHTFATMLFNHNVDLKTISYLLGHSDTSVTLNTYIHLAPKALGMDGVKIIDFTDDLHNENVS